MAKRRLAIYIDEGVADALEQQASDAGIKVSTLAAMVLTKLGPRPELVGMVLGAGCAAVLPTALPSTQGCAAVLPTARTHTVCSSAAHSTYAALPQHSHSTPQPSISSISSTTLKREEEEEEKSASPIQPIPLAQRLVSEFPHPVSREGKTTCRPDLVWTLDQTILPQLVREEGPGVLAEVARGLEEIRRYVRPGTKGVPWLRFWLLERKFRMDQRAFLSDEDLEAKRAKAQAEEAKRRRAAEVEAATEARYQDLAKRVGLTVEEVRASMGSREGTREAV